MITIKSRRDLESAITTNCHIDLHRATRNICTFHRNMRKISSNILTRDHKLSYLNFVFIILVLLNQSSQFIVNCEQVNSTTGSRIIPETTLANDSVDINATSATDLSSSEHLLLSEPTPFVDFTENPTLLFDSLTNNQNDEDTNKTTATTTAPQISATSESSSTPPESISSTTTTTTTSTAVTAISKLEESTTTTHLENDENSDPDSESDSDQDGVELKAAQFVPPQNVSQYMDYIERLFHDLRHQITYLFEPHIPQLIRTSQMVELSASCSHDILRMALALRQLEPWALKMIDSSGKLPEGIFEGSFTSLGSYDQCLNILFMSSRDGASGGSISNDQTTNTSMVTQGKYCLVNVSPFLPPKPYPFERVDRLFQEEANRRNYSKDDQLSRLSPMFYYMRFRIGICVPSTCDHSDMLSISQALSSSLKLNITIDTCRYKQIDDSLSTNQLVTGSIAAIVIGLVLAATIMDYCRQSSDKMLRDTREGGEIILMGVPDGTINRASNQSDHNRRPISRVLKVSGSSKSFQVITDFGNDNSLKSNKRSNWSTQGKMEELNYGSSPNEVQNPGNQTYGKMQIDTHCIKRSWRSFSFITNFRLYFQNKTHRPPTHPNDSDNNANDSVSNSQDKFINCLNGIRVLSLCWVIVANSYITLDPRATKGLTRTREAPRDFLFQLIVQASLAIETFFFLSGLLMSLSFSRQQLSNFENSGNESDDEKNKKHGFNLQLFLRWIRFYLHRYVRLTAPAMLVIAFTMFTFRYGDGPLWYEVTHRAHMSCGQNWWRHLLHVANFIDTRQMCFIHYWYIAADMQLFLFAPLLLLLLNKFTRFGLLLMGSLGFATVSWIFHTTFMRNLPPTLLFYSSDPESRREFGNTIMTKPYTHFLPYLVGMLLGHWLNRCQINSQSDADNEDDCCYERVVYGQSSRHSSAMASSLSSSSFPMFKWIEPKSLSKILAFLASLIVFSEIFLPYLWNNSQLPSPMFASLYAALFRFGWALALAYLVISCRHKRGNKCRISSHHNERVKQDTTIRSATSYKQYNHNNNSYTISGPQGHRDWCWCGSGGSVLNKFLSLGIFNHLSRLSYIAYLIHLPLMSVFVAQTRAIFAFSHLLVIHLALSYLLMTFILSFILVHIIEFPFITLERYIFEYLTSNRKSKRDEQIRKVGADLVLESKLTVQNHVAG